MQLPSGGGSLTKRGERTRRSGHGRGEKRRATVSGLSPARRPSRSRRRGDDVDERTSDDAHRLPTRRRYVKSKPPKRMPGGRVIPSGEGTLTEVFRSFYVAHGSTTTLGLTAEDVHLVVPVNDELQEVSGGEDGDGEEVTAEHQAAAQDVRGGGERSLEGASSSTPQLSEDAGILPRLPSEVASAQLPMDWYSARQWTAVKPSVLPFTPSSYDPQFQDYESAGAIMDLMAAQSSEPHYQQGYSHASGGSFSTELSRMRAAAAMIGGDSEGGMSAPLSPRSLAADFISRGGDSSYFNLADELMPETKPNSTTTTPKGTPFPYQPPPPPHMWDSSAMSFHPPRSGMPYGEVPSFTPAGHGGGYSSTFAPPPPPLPPSSQTILPPPPPPFAPWEAEAPLPHPPSHLPAFKVPSSFAHLPYHSYPHHTKHVPEINPRSFSFYSDRYPLLQTSPNLLI